MFGPHDSEGEGRIYLSDSYSFESGVAIRNLIAEEIYPKAIKSGYSYYIVAYSLDWERKIDTVVLKDKHPMKDKEFYYSLNQSKFNQNWRQNIPEGFSIEPIGKEIIERSANMSLLDLYTNFGPLHKFWILHKRKTLETFLEKGFGYLMVNSEDKIVAWCRTDFVIGSRCEFAVRTHENYRRKGLATCVVSATVEHAFNNNITDVVWHCWEDNVASQKTAEKVGFERTRVQTVHFAFYNEELNLRFKKNWDREHSR